MPDASSSLEDSEIVLIANAEIAACRCENEIVLVRVATITSRIAYLPYRFR